MASAASLLGALRALPLWQSAALVALTLLVAGALAAFVFRAHLPIMFFSFDRMHVKLDALARKYPDRKVIVFWAGWRRFVFVTDPAGVNHVMVTHRHTYPKISDTKYVLGPALGNGLLVNNDEVWNLHRSELAFLVHDTFGALNLAAIHEAGDKIVRTCLAAADAGRELSLYEAMDEVTTDVMTQIVLGTRFPKEVHHALGAMFGELERQVQRLFRFHKHLPSFKRTMKTLNDYIYGTINERRAAIAAAPADRVYSDCLSRMLQSGKLDDVAIRDEVLTLMFAGHDAIALALTFTSYLVAQHPDVAAKIKAEAEAVLGSTVHPTMEQASRLKYSRAVFTEGMRYWSPVPLFGRTARTDDTILGEKVHKGDSVIMCSYAMHRRADLYPNPEQFNPDRFANDYQPPMTQYFPFAVSPRACLGRQFAHLEASIILPMVFRHVALETTRCKDPLHPLWHYGLTAQPEEGMWVRVKRLPATK